MDNIFLDFISSRHCKRTYLDKYVPPHLLRAVLAAASNAPSAKNMQCCEVAVVSGAKRDQLSAALCHAFDAGEPGAADYQYMMKPVDEMYMQRARMCGYNLFTLKGIGRTDKAARLKHTRENFTFFNAPVQMIFHLPANAQPGMFLDMGCFIQTVMLAIKAVGLDSCPQFSVARYPDIIRDQLNLGADRLIVNGLSVGYADERALVNTFVPQRLDLEHYVAWYE